MRIDAIKSVAALNAAKRVLDEEENSLIYGYAIGGWDGCSKYELSIEGKYYIKPIRLALKKIKAALDTLKQ